MAKMTIPLALAAPLGVAGIRVGKDLASGEYANAVQDVTGFDASGKFHWPELVKTYGPVVAGLVMHKAANKFGVNRALANAGIPLIRI